MFVCSSWDALFPRALLKARPIVGSDRSLLILDTGLESRIAPSRFQFDASWLLIDGFCDMISIKISSFLSAGRRSFRP